MTWFNTAGNIAGNTVNNIAKNHQYCLINVASHNAINIDD